MNFLDAILFTVKFRQERHPSPRKKQPSESSDKISQVFANAKSSDPRNNDLPKIVTSKVISLFAKNNG